MDVRKLDTSRSVCDSKFIYSCPLVWKAFNLKLWIFMPLRKHFYLKFNWHGNAHLNLKIQLFWPFLCRFFLLWKYVLNYLLQFYVSFLKKGITFPALESQWFRNDSFFPSTEYISIAYRNVLHYYRRGNQSKYLVFYLKLTSPTQFLWIYEHKDL